MHLDLYGQEGLRVDQHADAGGDHRYPDLSSVGPVVTDYRDSRPVNGRWRRILLGVYRRRVLARVKRLRARQGPPIQLRYHGAVTVGSPGRARLHGRDGGIGDLIWEGLKQAGWIGYSGERWPTMELVMCVPRRQPEQAIAARLPLLPGGPRRRTELGQAKEGGICYRCVGPPRGEMVAGRGLVESARRPEDFDSFENMLYTAAIQGGWLSPEQNQPETEVPDVDILIHLTRPRV
ncbi:MAG: hypothetical protein JO342_12945 [Solirubrobacterales bacterium]|nr:hypothetical protein [Solirubrobacterales bacterium]MBV9167047.1 hypothetical protein [Solirubrobacterales bacterium]